MDAAVEQAVRTIRAEFGIVPGAANSVVGVAKDIGGSVLIGGKDKGKSKSKGEVESTGKLVRASRSVNQFTLTVPLTSKAQPQSSRATYPFPLQFDDPTVERARVHLGTTAWQSALRAPCAPSALLLSPWRVRPRPPTPLRSWRAYSRNTSPPTQLPPTHPPPPPPPPRRRESVAKGA